MRRRDFIKTLGAVLAGAVVPTPALAEEAESFRAVHVPAGLRHYPLLTQNNSIDLGISMSTPQIAWAQVQVVGIEIQKVVDSGLERFRR